MNENQINLEEKNEQEQRNETNFYLNIIPPLNWPEDVIYTSNLIWDKVSEEIIESYFDINQKNLENFVEVRKIEDEICLVSVKTLVGTKIFYKMKSFFN